MQKSFFPRLCFVSLSFSLFSFLITVASGTQITFDQNAYSNIVVAVSPDVSETQAATIIQNIKVTDVLQFLLAYNSIE